MISHNFYQGNIFDNACLEHHLDSSVRKGISSIATKTRVSDDDREMIYPWLSEELRGKLDVGVEVLVFEHAIVKEIEEGFMIDVYSEKEF